MYILASFVVAGLAFGIMTIPLPTEIAEASANTDVAANTAVENESTNSTNSTTPSSRTTIRSATTQRSQLMQLGSSTVYVALGDSIASGAGLTEAANATSTDQICDRSPEAYPYVIAQQLGTSVTHLACSGAKVDEGIYGEQVRSGTAIPVQLDGAFANGTPDIMTMTIGANDARWTSFIRQCYAVRCGSSFDEARAKIYRGDLRLELYRALNQIEQRSEGAPPRVLLSGYYAPFANLDCVVSNRITPTEQAWLKEQSTDLNQAIRSVVPYFDFAEYVPLNFNGHELCSDDPWIQGVDAAAPFHPTADGQAAIAEAFLTRIEFRQATR